MAKCSLRSFPKPSPVAVRKALISLLEIIPPRKPAHGIHVDGLSPIRTSVTQGRPKRRSAKCAHSQKYVRSGEMSPILTPMAAGTYTYWLSSSLCFSFGISRLQKVGRPPWRGCARPSLPNSMYCSEAPVYGRHCGRPAPFGSPVLAKLVQ